MGPDVSRRLEAAFCTGSTSRLSGLLQLQLEAVLLEGRLGSSTKSCPRAQAVQVEQYEPEPEVPLQSR